MCHAHPSPVFAQTGRKTCLWTQGKAIAHDALAPENEAGTTHLYARVLMNGAVHYASQR